MSYTVESSPPLIHTVSQALKTENMPDTASALMELILKRETVNNDTPHSQLLFTAAVSATKEKAGCLRVCS